MEYESKLVSVTDIISISNVMAEHCWRLHSVLDWGEGQFKLIFERGSPWNQ